MTKQEQQERLNALYSKRQNLLNNLSATDYIAAKIAEGSATKTEYRERIESRQRWRDEINAAENEILQLEAINPEDTEISMTES